MNKSLCKRSVEVFYSFFSCSLNDVWERKERKIEEEGEKKKTPGKSDSERFQKCESYLCFNQVNFWELIGAFLNFAEFCAYVQNINLNFIVTFVANDYCIWYEC